MMNDIDSIDLTGKLLIAMPGMDDPRFVRSVIYMCAYSSEDAMGLIINKPAPGLHFKDLIEQMNMKVKNELSDITVQFGGPVEQGRGFVLHSPEFEAAESTIKVDSQFSMTANRDVLEAIAAGEGPQNAILMLGYSGWGPGQLEQEIARNGWLVADASPDIVFGSDSDSKWTQALNSLGIDPLVLSATAGRA